MNSPRPAPQKKLSDDELSDVVEEVARQQNEAGIPLETASEALHELDMPTDRLEEAVANVRMQRKLQAQAKAITKRRLSLALAGAAIALMTIVGVVGYAQRQTTMHAQITASQSALTEESGQLKLTTKLMDAPKGDAVNMSCTWRTPEGTLLHENVWETKPVTHDAWETHCVLRETPTHVRVEMRAFDRVVAESSR
jgi:hypothetical protein